MQTVTTVIVGAGQAGLAMSRALSRRGVDHVVLDRGAVAQAWKDRWDSLTLLTPNWANPLPGAPYDGPDPHGFMAVSDFAARLASYAVDIAAPVRTETELRRAQPVEDGFHLETSQGPMGCAALVFAAGACALASTPAIAAAAPSSVFQITSSAYKRPDDLPEGGVLVVGASASGVQLAREIHLSGRPVILAVGGHTRLPRAYRGRDIEWWLEMLGFLDERAEDVEDLGRARGAPSPQIVGGSDAVDLNALQDLGVEIVGRLADVRAGAALFSGGLGAQCASADLKMGRLLDEIDAWIADRELDVAAEPPERPAPTRIPPSPRLTLDLMGGPARSIVWATGYRPDFSWLDAPVFDARGRLRHRGGVVDAPGLYALGLPLLRRRRSHQISGVADDARALADHLVRGLERRRAA